MAVCLFLWLRAETAGSLLERVYIPTVRLTWRRGALSVNEGHPPWTGADGSTGTPRWALTAQLILEASGGARRHLDSSGARWSPCRLPAGARCPSHRTLARSTHRSLPARLLHYRLSVCQHRNLGGWHHPGIL